MVKLVEGVSGVFLHLCPGCKDFHYFHTTYKNRSNASWSFDGNLEQPTFHPSMNIGPSYCHYWLRQGKIEFLADCQHALKGQSVELPEFELDNEDLKYLLEMLGRRVSHTGTSP
jgi:hypothetical protein